MYLIFIVLMNHHLTSNLVHEVLGISFFILFIIHQILNYKYYKAIFKGKYNLKRTIKLIVNLLFALSIFLIIISSINISNEVFAFLKIDSKIWGRSMHLCSTSWAFVLMSMHVGLHLEMFTQKVNKIIKNASLKRIYHFILILIFIFGLYSFFNLNYISDMFLLNPFKYYDYSKPPAIYYIQVIASSIFIQISTNFIYNLKKKEEYHV